MGRSTGVIGQLYHMSEVFWKGVCIAEDQECHSICAQTSIYETVQL